MGNNCHPIVYPIVPKLVRDRILGIDIIEELGLLIDTRKDQVRIRFGDIVEVVPCCPLLLNLDTCIHRSINIIENGCLQDGNLLSQDNKVYSINENPYSLFGPAIHDTCELDRMPELLTDYCRGQYTSVSSPSNESCDPYALTMEVINEKLTKCTIMGESTLDELRQVI